MRGSIVCLFAAALCRAQPAFEAATVKAAGPGIRGLRGGPGTTDPERIDYVASLRSLLVTAYELKDYQVSGPPSLTDVYEVVAKVPAGASKEQVQVMLQNLLIERFDLKLHHETRDFSGYELTIAKGGSKLKKAVDVPNAADLTAQGAAPMKLDLDGDGFPKVPPGRSFAVTYAAPNGQLLMTARMYSIATLARILGAGLGGVPIVDRTGLAGSYDFNLRYANPNERATDEPAPDLAAAVEQQLGLKLEAKKLSLDVLVIDHAEKTPAEN